MNRRKKATAVPEDKACVFCGGWAPGIRICAACHEKNLIERESRQRAES